MIISLVVAAAENNAIGKDNQLLWHLPKDMKFFKNVTWAMPVIMGRKTFEALGKPLNGRENFVITRQNDFAPEGVTVTASLQDAITAAEKKLYAKEVMVIGGGEIYKQAMGIANRIYITRIHASFDGDTYFPEIDTAKWQLVTNVEHAADEKNKYAMSFQKWERITE